MMDHHEEFVRAKRNNLVDVFWTSAAHEIKAPRGKTVEDMISNIGKDYRDIVKAQSRSGAGTNDLDPNPQIKGSRELYLAYDDYHRLYFPRGNAAKPSVIVTPSGVKRLGTSGPRSLTPSSWPPPQGQTQRMLQLKRQTSPDPDHHSQETNGVLVLTLTLLIVEGSQGSRSRNS